VSFEVAAFFVTLRAFSAHAAGLTSFDRCAASPFFFAADGQLIRCVVPISGEMQNFLTRAVFSEMQNLLAGR
jgi:hypothetical protein